MSEEEFMAFAESKPLRKEFMLAMGRKGFPATEMNAALDRMRRTYARMDSAIADSGGPWLLGRTITLADVMVMPAIVRMADLGLGHMWNEMPRIGRWFDEIRGHAAFAPTYYHGSLLTERFPHLKARAAGQS
jgi:glutathione S-transferase